MGISQINAKQHAGPIAIGITRCSFWSASVMLKNFGMIHGIAACILLFAFTPAHALEAVDPCANPPSDEWELLSAPPPESEQMLAITLKPETQEVAGMPVQKDAWFHSKSGAFRHCQYYGPTDRCDARSGYLDFQRRNGNGNWYVASAGTMSHCPVHPQKCGPSSPIESTDNRPGGKSVAKPVARPAALRSIADRLSEAWSPPSADVFMAITLRKQADKDLLHFCIENTSMHSLDLNDSALPWKAPNLFRLTVLNASGAVVFKSSGFVHQLMSPPAPHALNASDSVEGDLELSQFRFYEAAAKENLLLMWSGPVELYGKSTSAKMVLPVSGIMFVPKH
jgi:hypothetical protein